MAKRAFHLNDQVHFGSDDPMKLQCSNSLESRFSRTCRLLEIKIVWNEYASKIP